MQSTITADSLMAAVAQIEQGAYDIVSGTWALSVQEQMRGDARWTDRNGPSVTGLNARQSLKVQCELLPGDQIHIVGSTDRASPREWHGAPAIVGAFLELGTRFMDKYDVIWPTLMARAPELTSLIGDALAPDFSG